MANEFREAAESLYRSLGWQAGVLDEYLVTLVARAMELATQETAHHLELEIQPKGLAFVAARVKGRIESE